MNGTDTSRPIPAIVQPAYDVGRLAAEVSSAHKAWKRADDDERRLRLDLGRALLRAREAFPQGRGVKSEWGEFLDALGIDQRRASDWMSYARGVPEGSPSDGELPTMRSVIRSVPLPSTAAATLKARVAAVVEADDTDGDEGPNSNLSTDEKRSEAARKAADTRQHKRAAKQQAEQEADERRRDREALLNRIDKATRDALDALRDADEESRKMSEEWAREEREALAAIVREFEESDRKLVAAMLHELAATLEVS